ncbi:hypothetical protein [Sporomusa ovata]|uniref:Prophage Clp protease-like protein n=1 Tax=Sporomusa ovata TaxID=2378 RepID=A0A0U1L2D6_9FIRM|nr:hypothetical protein [Sporomusa ovata]CQR73831.1 Prophage Clp protease-like protein [Sporomusa ovata]
MLGEVKESIINAYEQRTGLAAANDATLNIAIANGTCAGLTAVPTLTDTTPGVAPV